MKINHHRFNNKILNKFNNNKMEFVKQKKKTNNMPTKLITNKFKRIKISRFWKIIILIKKSVMEKMKLMLRKRACRTLIVLNKKINKWKNLKQKQIIVKKAKKVIKIWEDHWFRIVMTSLLWNLWMNPKF